MQFSQNLRIEYRLRDKLHQKGFKERKLEFLPERLVITEIKREEEQNFFIEELKSVDRLPVKDIVVRFEFLGENFVTINFGSNSLQMSLFLESLISNWSERKIPALKIAKEFYKENLGFFEKNVPSILTSIRKHDYQVVYDSLVEITDKSASFYDFLRSKELKILLSSINTLLKSLEASSLVDARTSILSQSNSDDFLLAQHDLASMDEELFMIFKTRSIEYRNQLYGHM